MMLYYRPILKMIHLIEYRFFGQNPIGYNAVNIILNAFAVSLVFLLIYSFFDNMIIASISTLLFAVNPSHVEAVSWAYSDSYIISLLLCLGSLYSYHARKYVISLVLLAPALLTHESSLHMLAIFGLYELTIYRDRLKNALLRLMPIALLETVYLIVRHLVVPDNTFLGLPIANPLQASIIVLQRYVKIFLLPDALITVYPSSTFKYTEAELFASITLCVLLVYIVVLLVRKKRFQELFWFGWFFVWLIIPVAAIIKGNLGDFLMMDKSLYIPSLGFCVVISSMLTTFTNKFNIRIYAYVIVGIIVGFYAFYTFSRTRYWQSNIVYFEKAYEFEPNFSTLAYSLGLEYINQGDINKAKQMFLRAIELNPVNSLAYTNLGNIYFITGNNINANYAWESAIKLDMTNPIPYFNLGLLKEKEGKKEEALKMYHRYLELSPQAPDNIRTRIRMLE